MDLQEDPLSIIERWKKKSLELSTTSNDFLLALISNGFDALSIVLDKEIDRNQVRMTLASLEDEQKLSLLHDNEKIDDVRSLVYGFVECVRLTVSLQFEEFCTNVHPQENTNQYHMDYSNEVDHQNDMMEDDNAFVKIENMMSDCGDDIFGDEDFMEQKPFVFRDERAQSEIATLNFMEEMEPFVPDYEDEFETMREIYENEQEIEENQEEEGNQEEEIIENIQNTKKRGQSVAQNKSQLKSKKKKQTISVKDVKCPRCEYRSKNVETWRTHLQRIHSLTPSMAGVVLRCDCGVVTQRGHMCVLDVTNFTVIRTRVKSNGNNVIKTKPTQPVAQNKDGSCKVVSTQSYYKRTLNISETEIMCPKCQFGTKSLAAFRAHLRNKHATTAAKAGFVFRCDCGMETFTGMHICELDSTNYVLIRKKVQSGTVQDMRKPAQSIVQKRRISQKVAPLSKSRIEKQTRSETEMDCPKCEFRSKSVQYWHLHIKTKHSTTAVLAGVALRCDCGHESFSGKHSCELEVSNFKVIRKKVNKLGSLKQKVSASTVIRKTIAPVHNRVILKRKEPTQRRITKSQSKKIQFRSETDIECPQCEHRTKSIDAFRLHLKQKHSTTAAISGFVLRCDCGMESPSGRHMCELDVTNFTLVQKK